MLVYIEHPATLCNVLPRIKISISAGCVGPPKTRIVNASFVGHLAGAGVYIALVARDGIGMLLRNQMAPQKTHFGFLTATEYTLSTTLYNAWRKIADSIQRRHSMQWNWTRCVKFSPEIAENGCDVAWIRAWGDWMPRQNIFSQFQTEVDMQICLVKDCQGGFPSQLC